MTAVRYVVGCCSTVAEIEVSDDHVTISPPVGEELYRVQAPPRITESIQDQSGGTLDHEGMLIEYQARDRIHTLIMGWVEVAERHVSEAIWPDHSSWIIRCLACGQQFEVANLPKLAHVLGCGDWSVTGGVVPLGVLNLKAT